MYETDLWIKSGAWGEPIEVELTKRTNHDQVKDDLKKGIFKSNLNRQAK